MIKFSIADIIEYRIEHNISDLDEDEIRRFLNFVDFKQTFPQNLDSFIEQNMLMGFSINKKLISDFWDDIKHG